MDAPKLHGQIVEVLAASGQVVLDGEFLAGLRAGLPGSAA